jgi:hypothetical protein
MRKRILTPVILSLSLLATSPAEAAGSPAEGRNSDICTKYVNLARKVGWPKSDRWMLRLIMYRESRCQPTSIGRNRNTKGEVTSQDWGLLQINDVSWVRYLRDLGIIKDREDLLNPRINLTAALALRTYSVERGLSPWHQWRTSSPNGSAGSAVFP